MKKMFKESDFDWIDEVPVGILLRPRTVYYAEPPLSPSEANEFWGSIINETQEFQETVDNIRSLDFPLSYLIVFNKIRSDFDWRWSAEGDYRLMESTDGYEEVDIRKSFI